jgi:negative regulator of sigma E activity
MVSEELEFSISQYLDGTLSESESAALEERFATDAEARAILAEYQQLNSALQQNLPLPAVDFDALAMKISSAVANEELPQRRLFIGTWQTRTGIAIAASVLLAIGIAVKLYAPTKPSPPSLAQTAVIEVAGPSAELAGAKPIVDISISPAPGLAQNNWRIAEDVIYRPARVTWLASTIDNSQDTNDSY